MVGMGNVVLKGLLCICDGIQSFVEFLIGTKYEEEKEMEGTTMNGVENKSVIFSDDVLDEFRKNVGKFRAETGGMLASSQNEHVIDKCHFDTHSKNTSGTFYYDVESMSEVFRNWKSKGYVTNGIYHSHPKGVTRPSFHDISSALLHIDFFELDYFYLPIFQPEHRGFYTMYFYVVSKEEQELVVNLNYVLEATQDGYKFPPFCSFRKSYSIRELNSYRESIDRPIKTEEKPVIEASRPNLKTCNSSIGNAYGTMMSFPEASIDRVITKQIPKKSVATSVDKEDISMTKKATISEYDYFQKVSSLYPDKVLDKVLVCIGTGGARSFLENCARSGFRNYILMDADTVTPSNVATQGVFISEMGKKKVEVIRERILDINPTAKVICVDRFLDDGMSDEEFKGIMDRFPNKQPKDYLILGCTDNFEAQKRSSLLALKYGTPYLAAMMYEAGAAAEIIFVYPGVTESCPRCLLRDRFEKYENGFQNDVDSSACPIFATERMNSLKGYIALMLLMYKEAPGNPLSRMLDDVKDRNFVEIRLNPYLKDSKLGIKLFDKVFEGASRYTYMDETIWVPQHPDSPKYGSEPCRLCGGRGNLKELRYKWSNTDTRTIRFDKQPNIKTVAQMKLEHSLVGLETLPKVAGSFEAKV